MNHNKKPFPFTPLNPASQGSSENVLYYDNNASLDAIYSCANSRVMAVAKLLNSLPNENDIKPELLSATTIISRLVLNEATTLLEELNPVALELRKRER